MSLRLFSSTKLYVARIMCLFTFNLEVVNFAIVTVSKKTITCRICHPHFLCNLTKYKVLVDYQSLWELFSYPFIVRQMITIKF